MSLSPLQEQTLLLDALRSGGPLTAAELGRRLGKSQPTLSRWLRRLSTDLVVLGQGRATRYALPQTLLGASARQPLHWVHANGQIEAWGEMTLLANHRVHVRASGVDAVFHGLPWFMTPLRAQGFLGRALARRLAPLGFDANPERWSLAQVLYAAMNLSDAPGALQLGPPVDGTDGEVLPLLCSPADHDRWAANAARALPAGSSAGGEQAKFLTRSAAGEPVLVKFSPPRGTPFGERWHDLLVAEHLALALLAEHGVPVALAELVHTDQRSHLVSRRFDRVGQTGRRHVVALDAWHDAFVAGPRQHWAATCTELMRQRRVPPETPAQALALLHFGRLIGNTDMHFGNLSLWVEADEVAAGRGRLAPIYDMLPMRWRPDAQSGDFGLMPFEPDLAAQQSAAAPLAREFWSRCADERQITRPFRVLASEMWRRLS